MRSISKRLSVSNNTHCGELGSGEKVWSQNPRSGASEHRSRNVRVIPKNDDVTVAWSMAFCELWSSFLTATKNGLFQIDGTLLTMAE